MSQANDLLALLKRATTAEAKLAQVVKADIALSEAKAFPCTCSGFVLQYEGRCCCPKQLEVNKASQQFENAIRALTAA